MVTNTGVRCIVVFRKVPGEENMCLLVETERLPDSYHDNIIEYVNSREAQETSDFYEILNRRTFSDGLNALQALHYKNFLRKVPIEQVILTPLPGHQLPLAMANAQIDGTIEEYASQEEQKAEAVKAEAVKADPMGDPNDPVVIAKGILLQADLLEAEAKSKREQAYAMAPTLMADVVATEKKRGRPALSEEEKAAKAEERKAKRRERDRAKAAEKKAKAEAEKKQKAVDNKVVRDAIRASKSAEA
jgi:hypothetical protein